MIAALIGNQNSGKTTLFNQLTGSKQKVGNFPGVTVSKKEALLKGHPGITIVDLPGIYSLSPYSAEELVTRDFLTGEKPDLIINIIDTTHIERSLYLTLQLLELEIPTILALNMMDEVRARGAHVHFDAIMDDLGVPIVPISAGKGEGIDVLIKQAVQVSREGSRPLLAAYHNEQLESTLHSIAADIEVHAETVNIPARFAATKLCEGDSHMIDRLKLSTDEAETIENMVLQFEADAETDRLAAMADSRYRFIDQVCADAIHRSTDEVDPLTQKLDRVLTHKRFAIPIFFVLIFGVFWLSFTGPGAWLSELFEGLIGWITGLVDGGLTAVNIHPVLHSLVIDGIFSGVGSVLSFLPLILVLFFLLSILEDSGYMARVAFVMDSGLRRLGLTGASIVPMIMGFGCTVPAVMSTRTLASERDRRLTVFLVPFMSCTAKVPIYGAIASVFFPGYAGLLMVSLYLFGILLAVMTGIMFKKNRSDEDAMPFIMELPPYRFPSAKSVLRGLGEKVRNFMVRAFTVILIVTVLIWFLQTFNPSLQVAARPDESILALLGGWLVPIFAPLGFADWRAPAALISGLTAKEAVISSLAVMSEATVDTLGPAFQQIFTPLSALSFLAFTLIYAPCVAAIGAARMELRSWSQTGLMVAAQTGVAWLVSAMVYQVGYLLNYRPLMGGFIMAAIVTAITAYLIWGLRKPKEALPAGAAVNA